MYVTHDDCGRIKDREPGRFRALPAPGPDRREENQRAGATDPDLLPQQLLCDGHRPLSPPRGYNRAGRPGTVYGNHDDSSIAHVYSPAMSVVRG